MYNSLPTKETIGTPFTMLYEKLPSKAAIGETFSAMYGSLPTKETMGAPFIMLYEKLPSKAAIGETFSAMYNSLPTKETMGTPFMMLYDNLPTKETMGIPFMMLYEKLPSKAAINETVSAMYNSLPTKETIGTPFTMLYEKLPSKAAIGETFSAMYGSLPTKETMGAPFIMLYDNLPSKAAISETFSTMYNSLPTKETIGKPFTKVGGRAFGLSGWAADKARKVAYPVMPKSFQDGLEARMRAKKEAAAEEPDEINLFEKVANKAKEIYDLLTSDEKKHFENWAAGRLKYIDHADFDNQITQFVEEKEFDTANKDNLKGKLFEFYNDARAITDHSIKEIESAINKETASSWEAQVLTQALAITKARDEAAVVTILGEDTAPEKDALLLSKTAITNLSRPRTNLEVEAAPDGAKAFVLKRNGQVAMTATANEVSGGEFVSEIKLHNPSKNADLAKNLLTENPEFVVLDFTDLKGAAAIIREMGADQVKFSKEANDKLIDQMRKEGTFSGTASWRDQNTIKTYLDYNNLGSVRIGRNPG